MSGLYDYIEIDQVLSSVKGDMGIQDTSSVYDGNIERWINDAVGQVDACDFYIKKPVFLTLDDNHRVKVPRGYRQFIAMRFTAQTIDEVTTDGFNRANACGDIIYYDMSFVTDCGCRPDKSHADYMNTVEIIDGHFQFRNIPSSVQTIELTYMGSPVSGDCLYFIPPDYERACSAYARARAYEAYPELKGVQMSMALLPVAQKEWKAQKAFLKSKAAKRNFDTNKYFIKTYFQAWFVRQNKTW